MPQYHKGYNKDAIQYNQTKEEKEQTTIDEFGKIDKEDNERFLYGKDEKVFKGQ